MEGSERCTASSFVRGRAQLAATLTCANVEALRSEIGLAEQQTAQWADVVDGGRIYDDVVASSYVTLQRFQNEDSQCMPRTQREKSAISHVRETAREHSSVGHRLERYRLGLARLAGWHMRGLNKSPFVSLVEDASKLLVSRDPWVRTIAERAERLHTYTVPRATVWTPEGIMSSIALGMKVEDHYNVDEDTHLMEVLSRIPSPETEVLFLGGNLDEYRTASEHNPYRGGPIGSEGAQPQRRPALIERAQEYQRAMSCCTIL